MRKLTLNGYTINILFSEAEIAARVTAIAQSVADCKPQKLLVIAVLKGSFIYAADLVRALHHTGLQPEVDFMMLASYRDKTTSSGMVEIMRDITTDVRGRDVLLIDDILESGRTLAFAKDLLIARGANQVLTTVLLDKPQQRGAEIEADFEGFTCPDQFVVGYGMDMANAFRELPFVGHVVSE